MKIKSTLIFSLLTISAFCFDTAASDKQGPFIPQANPLSDDAHWASAFVNHSLQKTGVEGTRSRRALSWLRWGLPLKKPAVSSIAVIDYGGGRGHVGFVEGTYQNMIVLIGGNQSNEVNRTAFPLEDVTAYRWPKGPPPADSAYVLPNVRPKGAPPKGIPTVSGKGRRPSNRADLAEYQSMDQHQHLLIKPVGFDQIHFKVTVADRCDRTLSGTAYEIYPEDMEIDAEAGIGYPVREYFFWGDSQGTRGLRIRLSAKGSHRARVVEWGYNDPCVLSDAVLHGKGKTDTK